MVLIGRVENRPQFLEAVGRFIDEDIDECRSVELCAHQTPPSSPRDCRFPALSDFKLCDRSRQAFGEFGHFFDRDAG
jgi:hypothetical protein